MLGAPFERVWRMGLSPARRRVIRYLTHAIRRARFSGRAAGGTRGDPRQPAAGRRWLFTICAMILVMIVLGGATRLTGSGLSIMEWAPLSGTLPPMSDAEWHRLFACISKSRNTRW